MKHHYVETSNHDRFMAGVRALENRGSLEACIMLLTGEPGMGKTEHIKHFGAERQAVMLDSQPGMSLAYLNEYLSAQTGVRGDTKFQLQIGLENYLRETGAPIILDEAQVGLKDKGAVVEFLRRLAEKAGVMLILVCHTSEKHKFSEDRLAHIATRISCAPTLQKASVEDCAKYLMQLCEVQTNEGVARIVHEQSGGRYRLLSNACVNLERLAAKKNLGALTEADIKGIRLCEDVMRTHGRRAK